MTPRDDETARMGLEWIREDMREFRGALDDNTKELGRVAGLVVGCSKALEEHVQNCPARNRKNSSTTITPPAGVGMFGAVQRWAPLLLAVALGLLGLGAYFGQASTLEAKVQKLETLTKTMNAQRP